MKPPPMLLAAALVFWGWQTGYPVVGAILAVIVESPRWIKASWAFSDDDFRRIWVLCTLLALGALVLAFTQNEGPTELLGFLQNPNFRTQRNAGAASAKSVVLWMRWLPIVFFPFTAAQLFSTRQGIPLATISLLLQRRWKRAREAGQLVPPAGTFNIAYLYFALCLFSASLHAGDSLAFFWGLCVLLTWVLWTQRSRRYAVPLWAGVLAVSLALGYVGQTGLTHLRTYLERLNPQWLSNFGRGQQDPSQSRTALGNVGRIKNSGRIVIRVEPKAGALPPNLLREASYRTYKSPVWYSDSPKYDFEDVTPEKSGAAWMLIPDKTNTRVATVSCYLPGGQGLLPLPSGSSWIESQAAFLYLRKNGMGAVLAQGPGLLIFDARHGPGTTADVAGGTNDLAVNARELDAVNQVISTSQLRGTDDDDTLRRVNNFFQEKFTYSTWQEAFTGKTNETPLSRFLLRSRSGHCEFFATATVLLLRQMGIPARYAVGYAVHEAAGKNYVVRQRDAHAWCLAWNREKQVWQDFDTTPASWVEEEEKRASIFQFLQDAWSRLGFELSKLRWGQTHLRQYLLWALAPVLAILVVQIIVRSRRQRRAAQADSGADVAWPGLDSEFYQLTKLLAARRVPRPAGEPLASWLARAIADPALVELRGPLHQLLQLHYRYRFDPVGLSPAERETLRREVRTCAGRLTRLQGA